MPRPITSLIPPGIAWYPTVADFAKAGGIGMPGDKAKPRKMWRDNSAVYSGGWFSSLIGSRSYRMLARNADGSPKLTSMTSPEFYATYSTSVVNEYRRWAFLFQSGVPYVVDVEVAADQAADLNLIGTEPAVDWPLVLNADTMLVPNGNDVQVWGFEEFAAANRVPPQINNAMRRQLCLRALQSSAPDDAAIQQVREIVTVSGNHIYQTT